MTVDIFHDQQFIVCRQDLQQAIRSHHITAGPRNEVEAIFHFTDSLGNDHELHVSRYDKDYETLVAASKRNGGQP